MRQEAEDKDHRFIELLVEREEHMKELWTQKAHKLDDIMLCQMFVMIKDACHDPDESFTSRHD